MCVTSSHNKTHLFYGTHFNRAAYGNKRWLIRGYLFSEHAWLENSVHFSDMVGSDIGYSVCFELHDGFFYALSTETLDHPEDVDWTSFNHCFRFPLDSPCDELVEKTDNNCIWRRQHSEGPIDDRWKSLRLDCAEVSNDIRVVEELKSGMGEEVEAEEGTTPRPYLPLEEQHGLAAPAADATTDCD